MDPQKIVEKHFPENFPSHHGCGGNHGAHGHSHDHGHDHHNDHGHSHSQYQNPYEDDCCGHDHDHGSCGTTVPPQINTKFLDKSKYEVGNEFEIDGLKYVQYKDETQMPLIMNLITKDLSEPYSIYTYRYFIHNWPFLCFLVSHQIFNSTA